MSNPRSPRNTEHRRALQVITAMNLRRSRPAQLRKFETWSGWAEGFIYFLTVGEPEPLWVKVGFTKLHPTARLKALQTGCPLTVTLRGFVLGTKVGEAELHDVLQDDRERGEWFRWTDFVRRTVDDQLQSEAF